MKKQGSVSKYVSRTLGWLILTVSVMLTLNFTFIHSAQAQSDDAGKILKAMAEYITHQKALSVTFDSDIEVITSDQQKLQFTSSGQLQLSRPDKLHATRTGGYADIELVFDGKTITLNNRGSNNFAQLNSPGSVDQVVDLMRDKYSVIAPGADLFLSNVFNMMTEDVIESKHIGRGVVDGIECEHLAFRNLDTDWQIWIEVGARPIPHKYVITSKAVAGAPQYTLRIKEWRSDVAADAFTFNPDKSATKVALEALVNVDEIPQGLVISGKKAIGTTGEAK